MVVVARSADVAEEEEEPVGGPGNVGSEAGSGRAATDEVPVGGGGGGRSERGLDGRATW